MLNKLKILHQLNRIHQSTLTTRTVTTAALHSRPQIRNQTKSTKIENFTVIIKWRRWQCEVELKRISRVLNFYG